MRIDCLNGVSFSTRTVKEDYAIVGQVVRLDASGQRVIEEFRLSTYAQPVDRVRGLVYRTMCAAVKVYARNHAYMN